MCPSTGTLGTMEELQELFPHREKDYFVPVRTMTKRQDLTGKVEMYEPCPCGSGNKFKFCCHAKVQQENNKVQAARAAALLKGITYVS